MNFYTIDTQSQKETHTLKIGHGLTRPEFDTLAVLLKLTHIGAVGLYIVKRECDTVAVIGDDYIVEVLNTPIERKTKEDYVNASFVEALYKLGTIDGRYTLSFEKYKVTYKTPSKGIFEDIDL